MITTEEAVAEVRRILRGIDIEEGFTWPDIGWWQTSKGRDMGAEALAEIEALVTAIIEQRA